METRETQIRLEVPAGYREHERLDIYITRFLPNTSRSRVQEGIRDGRVQVDDVVVRKASYSVQPGSTITCTLLRPPPLTAEPEPIPIEVVYEDQDLVLVNKAAGMVVHPAYGNRTGTLVNALLYHVGGGTIQVDEDEELSEDELGLSVVNAVPQREGDPSIRPGIVHRLDKDTSGLLIVAKNDVTHRGLARQFSERTIRRTYHALVWRCPEPPAGRIETYVGRDPRDRKRMAVVRASRGKRAVTRYETVEVWEDAAYVHFTLETGRTHQIRVHAQHIGHPLLADGVYGGATLRFATRINRRRTFYHRQFQTLQRQALHAATLGFSHPRSGEQMDFSVPLPEDMAGVVEALRTFS